MRCPLCNALVHGTTLRALSAEAEAAEQAGQYSIALSKWREALDLLPPDTVQYQTVHQHVVRLSGQAGKEHKEEEKEAKGQMVEAARTAGGARRDPVEVQGARPGPAE